MDIDIQEAQKRLEQKRASLKLTQPEPIFSVKIVTATCEDCGAQIETKSFFDGFVPTPVCDDCKVKREAAYLEKVDAENKAKEARRKEQHQLRIATNLRSCSVGERFMGLTFDDYKPTCNNAARVLEACQDYVEAFGINNGASLMMIGSPGTGKNMLAAIIGQELIKRDFLFLHTTAMKLIRKVKDSWRNKEQSEQDVISSFVAPDLLVIDEIGVQFGSATEQLYLTEIINDRYEKRRSTILISNLKLSQLAEVMGERAIDRFYDDGSKILVFDWSSYRRLRMAA